MDDLTATELKVFNNLSLLRDRNISLGGKVQGIISMLNMMDTPVNALESTIDLTFTDVVVDGETLSVDNPLETGDDVYELCADDVQSLTSPGNIAVDITASTAKAAVTLTIDTQVLAGDTMVLEGIAYLFVTNLTANEPGEINVGTDLATCQAAIVAAINGMDGYNNLHPLVRAAAFSGNDCVISSVIGGTVGNAYQSTETFTAVTNVFSDVVLSGGTDCTAANAITAIVAAITASDTQGVAGADETGDVISLTADVAGVSGDDIAIAETFANATFAGAATELAGGVDGTVAPIGKMMVDATYLYLAEDDNTIADKNWTRTALTWATF